MPNLTFIIIISITVTIFTKIIIIHFILNCFPLIYDLVIIDICPELTRILKSFECYNYCHSTLILLFIAIKAIFT